MSRGVKLYRGDTEIKYSRENEGTLYEARITLFTEYRVPSIFYVVDTGT